MSTNSSKEKINLDEWLSQAQAAQLRGVSRQAIWKLVKSGRLRSINIGGHVLVNRSDVEKFRPLEPGRHKKQGKA